MKNGVVGIVLTTWVTILVGGWPTSEKSWTSSVGMIIPFPTNGKKTCSSHHQPAKKFEQFDSVLMSNLQQVYGLAQPAIGFSA